jgi:hypothetical protein
MDILQSRFLLSIYDPRLKLSLLIHLKVGSKQLKIKTIYSVFSNNVSVLLALLIGVSLNGSDSISGITRKLWL